MRVRLKPMLLAASLFVSACAMNPLIGREQLIVVPDSHLVAMSAQSWADIKQSTPVSRNVQVNMRANRVGARLLTAMEQSLSDWTIEVFHDEALNAFALPGRQIGITTAMMELCQSDDELAAVIGHEIAHVTLKHSAERVSQEVLARGAIGLIAPDDSRTAALLGAGASVGIILPYSRAHELEADKLGVSYLAKAGYRRRAAIDLWTRMAAAEGRSSSLEWLSTHPTDQRRIAALKEEVTRLEQKLRP